MLNVLPVIALLKNKFISESCFGTMLLGAPTAVAAAPVAVTALVAVTSQSPSAILTERLLSKAVNEQIPGGKVSLEKWDLCSRKFNGLIGFGSFKFETPLLQLSIVFSSQENTSSMRVFVNVSQDSKPAPETPLYSISQSQYSVATWLQKYNLRNPPPQQHPTSPRFRLFRPPRRRGLPTSTASSGASSSSSS